MQVAAGSRLGPYEILSRIGSGGMGEVFEARDTRLDRSVAIKVLPPEFADNPRLRLRFEREAKAISQLNHPHICTLHDVGENYLVMELLEGETVAERLMRGPLPMRDVIRFGAQIADALDRAHRARIIHRDLKPANVMLTRSGAKLLDFGLAKTGAAVIDLDGATQHKPLTEEGTILGTFQYMAPEQLEGEEADARTDIFALGALLYEMATGKRAFEGKTKTSLIAAIVRSEPPPLSQVQPLTPPAFEHVVTRCLAKQPDDRWQSAHDVAEHLRWISEAGSQSGVAITRARRSRRNLFAALAVAAALIAAGAILAPKLRRPEPRTMTSEIVPPEDAWFVNVGSGPVTISPDGRKLAFVTGGPRAQGLWVRDLTTGATRMFDGTRNATFPFWSPDGTSIGYFADEKLMVVNAATGTARAVCDAPNGRGGSWGPRGVIIFAPNLRGPIYRVDAAGGKPERLTGEPPETTSHRNPLFLPDGTHFLYVERTPADDFGTLLAGSLDDPSLRKVVQTNASNAAYASGMLLFRHGDALVARPFDLDSLSLEGQPAPLVQRAEYHNPRDLVNFSVSSNEMLVYRLARLALRQPVILDAEWREVAAVGDPANFYTMDPTLSADGRFFICPRMDASGVRSDLWLTDLQRGSSSRLTFLSSTNSLVGVLSPDGTRVAVSEYGGRASTVTIYSLGASGAQRKLATSEFPLSAEIWTPDGRALIATTQLSNSGWDIVTIDPNDGRITPIIAGRYDEAFPVLSRNGKWLAYTSNESGRSELYVTSFPTPGQRWNVSTTGTSGGFWSGSDTIVFRSGPALYSVAVRETAGGLELGAPKALSVDLKNYDAMLLPDGRWLALKPISDPRPEPLRLVTNWPSLIER